MADNVALDPMSGGASVRTTEDGSGKQHQHILAEFKDTGNSDVPTVADNDTNKFPVRATELETLIGEKQASPSSNTLLARVKSIEDDIDQMNVSLAYGSTSYRQTDLGNTKTAVKASSGRLHDIHVYNPNTAAVFVQFYDALSAGVTVGTTTPKKTIIVPPLGIIDRSLVPPWLFSTGITIAATTTVGGSTDPTSDLVINLEYT